jgi:hypothetical protein
MTIIGVIFKKCPPDFHSVSFRQSADVIRMVPEGLSVSIGLSAPRPKNRQPLNDSFPKGSSADVSQKMPKCFSVSWWISASISVQ